MAKATRTLNPLPFQDLEPHRFEDLVRQLAYDFKNWRSLEATGRLGSDDGYDARGLEILEAEEEDEEDDEHRDKPDSPPDRLWQFQCKREKAVTPAKIGEYSDEMLKESNPIPYGVIFAASCDFSKKTRDVFAAKMREKRVQEFHLWGRAELEDMLLQPKNDHLLFGYFGISLVIRRRSLKSQIRSVLATKRKAVKHLGAIESDGNYQPVLIRDVTDDKYPYSGSIANFKTRPHWKEYHFTGHTHDGIKVLMRRYIAYREIDSKTGELLKWDYTDEVNLATVYEDRWHKDKNYDDNFRKAHAFLDSMEENNRGFFEIEGVIPYDRIIEIDPLGDTIANCTHIYVEVRDESFFKYAIHTLVPRGHSGVHYPYAYEYRIEGKDEKRKVKFFPKKLPKPPEPEPLPPMGSGGKKADTEVN